MDVKIVDIISDYELAELCEAKNREDYLSVLTDFLDAPDAPLPILLFPTGYQPIVVTPPELDNWAELIGLLQLALSAETRELLEASDSLEEEDDDE